MKKKTKYYVVWKGRQTGIFDTWEACAAAVSGYSGAEFQSFESRNQAESAWKSGHRPVKKTFAQQTGLFSQAGPILPSICVDAACNGAPGRLEYRGVKTESGEQIFRKGPFAQGTNNVGEFLAIVDAIRWLKQRQLDWPIYSDSQVAIGWVRAGKCKTQLTPTAENALLFNLIAYAEEYLKTISGFRLLKWDTDAWGENPADFGRK